jgi:hypothetical protein
VVGSNNDCVVAAAYIVRWYIICQPSSTVKHNMGQCTAVAGIVHHRTSERTYCEINSPSQASISSYPWAQVVQILVADIYDVVEMGHLFRNLRAYSETMLLSNSNVGRPSPTTNRPPPSTTGHPRFIFLRSLALDSARSIPIQDTYCTVYVDNVLS